MILLINDDNYTSLPYIFNGILEIQEKGFDLSKEQLDIIKDHLDSFDDEVQELATKIYANSIRNNLNLLKSGTNAIISKINVFEPVVREKMISFIINSFSDISKYEKQLLKGLINCLDNDLWDIRKKIIEFLSDAFIERPRLISEFDNELQIILNEKDIDVIREGLDFLLKLYMKTFSVEDLQNLIKTIPQRDWISQEKIFFLITQLGIKRKELIAPITQDLVHLLDYDEYLVYKSIKKTIKEIMEYQEDIFDDTFLLFIEDDIIDNSEAIEDLLAYSILKKGFNRFYHIFNDFSEKIQSHVKVFNNIIKKLYKKDNNLTESIIIQLLNEVLKNLNSTNYLKLKMIINQNHQYDLYHIIYEALNDKGQLLNDDEELRRKELINILHSRIPELRFQKLKTWLDFKLKQGSVSIDELCNNFHIEKFQFIDILKRLIEEGFLHAVIDDNTIKPKDTIYESKNDIQFFKKWKIFQKTQENEYKINLSVQIKNISGKDISNLTVIKNYPKNLLIEEFHEKSKVDIPDPFESNQQLVFSWWFKKYYEKENNPISSNIKVIIIYQKEGKLFTIKKKLDILLF